MNDTIHPTWREGMDGITAREEALGEMCDDRPTRAELRAEEER